MSSHAPNRWHPADAADSLGLLALAWVFPPPYLAIFASLAAVVAIALGVVATRRSPRNPIAAVGGILCGVAVLLHVVLDLAGLGR